MLKKLKFNQVTRWKTIVETGWVDLENCAYLREISSYLSSKVSERCGIKAPNTQHPTPTPPPVKKLQLETTLIRGWGIYMAFSLYTDVVLFFFLFFWKTSARAVHFLSRALDGLWRGNRGSLNRLHGVLTEWCGKWMKWLIKARVLGKCANYICS